MKKQKYKIATDKISVVLRLRFHGTSQIFEQSKFARLAFR